MRDAGKFFKHLLFAAVAVATLVFAFTRTALAADRVVVFHTEGDGAEAMADDVKDQLPKGLVAGDPKKFETALQKAGHKGAMGKALDNTKQRDKLLEKVRKAGETAKVDVVVILRVKKGKKDRTVTILVVDPKSSALAREDEVSLPLKKGKDDNKKVVASVSPALEKFGGAEPPPPPPKKADKKDDDKKDDDKKDDDKKDDDKKDDDKKDDDDDKKKKDEPASDRKIGDPAHALFVVGAGVELGIRQFEYNQPITKNLRAYRVVGAPMLGFNLELYPLAGSKGPLGGIGIVGDYAQALALQSAAAGGAKVSTTWRRYGFGLRYRIPFGDKGGFVAPMVGYAAQAFTFSGLDDKTSKEAPAAKYGSVRIGVDGRLPAGPIGIMVGLGYLITSSPDGDLTLVSGRFPKMSVGGVDANLGLGIGVVKGLEARLLFRYTRFFYSMNPEPGDTYVAGGALDQLSSLHLGAAYVY